MLAGPTRPGHAAGTLTCEVLPELLLQLHGFVVDLICLLVRLPSVHFPAKDRRKWIPVLIKRDCSRLPENLPSCPLRVAHGSTQEYAHGHSTQAPSVTAPRCRSPFELPLGLTPAQPITWFLASSPGPSPSWQGPSLSRYSHERLDGLGLDENSDGVQLCLLQPLDGVAGDIQDAVLALKERKRISRPGPCLPDPRHLPWATQTSTQGRPGAALRGRENHPEAPKLHALLLPPGKGWVCRVVPVQVGDTLR